MHVYNIVFGLGFAIFVDQLSVSAGAVSTLYHHNHRCVSCFMVLVLLCELPFRRRDLDAATTIYDPCLYRTGFVPLCRP